MSISQGDACDLVTQELERATRKFGPFQSTHEGYAIILEELDEVWDEVKANRTQAACHEAIQVSAMAMRFVMDLAKADEWTS